MSLPGRLALVLHAHIPYVEGFGTWPHGEDWIHNAAATCYLPLVDLLDKGTPLTLSVTPVVADQLEGTAMPRRFIDWVRSARIEVIETDRQGLIDYGYPDLSQSLIPQQRGYEAAIENLQRRGGNVSQALMSHASWTSSATHAVLPLVATPQALDLQIRIGPDSHKRRTGRWNGGFWLPECAYSPALDSALANAGVARTCVDLTDIFGHGSVKHLTPYRTPSGTTLLPLDRQLMDLIWKPGAAPAAAAYRCSHKRTVYELMPWSNDEQPWDQDRALEQAHRDAQMFVAAAVKRVADGGIATVAFDAELFGLWWHEGVHWLQAVLEESSKQGLEIVSADTICDGVEPIPLPAESQVTTSWGEPRNLWTWSGPQVADIAWETRKAELDLLRRRDSAGPRAWRELLALQSSDWAFQVSRGVAGEYGRQRQAGHARELDLALSQVASSELALANLAPWLEQVMAATEWRS